MSKKIEDYKKIAITGSSKGLGAEIAKEACKRQFMYYGISRFSNLNITNYNNISEYFNSLELDPPAALVNNAGICKTGSILDIDTNDFKSVFDTNVFGLYNCCREYIKLCLKTKTEGKIINIASTAALGARPGRISYSSSKAAIVNLSLSLSAELKKHKIKVYCISPGAFVSDMRKEIAPDDDFDAMMKPEKIAKFIMDLIENDYQLDNQNLLIR